ncbi:MAG TPA: SDR family NAD(P)-dependent oxidoreductase [Burkholderiaceae bacterium]|nr:SDR family NAD(P)-dependent oxidoreductase [Burkholderiaceae bacterium]
MQLAILTGASRGLGLALAEQLLDHKYTLLTLSRRPNAALGAHAAGRGTKLEQWAIDVTASDVVPRLEAWLRQFAGDAFERAVLVNNAGVLGRVGPVDRMDPAILAEVLRVDLEAPAMISAAFLRATRAWRAERRVLNVSSGAGRVAITGWAAYCAAKAGLDHLSRVMALDEARQPNPAKIVSLAPGVIDTDMQSELRASDGSEFPDLARFKEFKATGQLAAPNDAAARLLAFLDRNDFGARSVADVRTD